MMTLDREKLLERLEIAGKTIVKDKAGLSPELKTFRLYSSNGKLFLEATNTEQSMRACLLDEDVEELDVLVDGDKFLRTVSEMEGDIVHLKILSTQIQIGNSKNEIKFATASPATFPIIPQFSDDSFFVADNFPAKLRSVISFIAIGDPRATFTSVYIDSIDPNHLKLTTVDGTRAAYNVVETLTPMQDEFRVLVPAKVLRDFVGYKLKGAMQVGFAQNKFMIKVEDIELMVGVIADKYPDTSALFKEPWDESLKFTTKEAIKALEMALIVAKESASQEGAGKFSVEGSEGIIEATSKDSSVAITRFPLDGTSESLHGIDLNKMKQALMVAPNIEIRFVSKKGKNSSWNFQNPDDPAWNHVVLPVSIR